MCMFEKDIVRFEPERLRGPQWPSNGLAGLASIHRQSPLCRFASHKWQCLESVQI